MAFPTIEEAEEILEKIAEEIPVAFYEELNLGIHLEPHSYLHPEGYGDLYVLGEYRVSVIGCQISIFYGSFQAVFPYANKNVLAKELKDTLLHEFKHHMERRAGEKDLEVEDEKEMRQYQHTYAKRGHRDAN